MIQTLYDLLLLSGILGVISGAGLLLIPSRMFEGHHPFRQWLLENDLIALLDRESKIERTLYRHHRLAGAAVTAASLLLLYLLANLQDYLFSTSVWNRVTGVRLAMIFSWTLAILAMIVGLFLFIRPSALKGVEKVANRWVEPLARADQNSEAEISGINKLILKYPRHTGLLLLSFGLICLWSSFAMQVS